MKIDFEKMGGLVPAIIQDATTRQVSPSGAVHVRHYGQRVRRQDTS